MAKPRRDPRLAAKRVVERNEQKKPSKPDAVPAGACTGCGIRKDRCICKWRNRR